MAISKTTGYNWLELDATTLPTDGKVAYEAMKAANRTAQEAREKFEQIMGKHMPEATFGYRFGKLSFTVDAPKEKKARGVSSKAMSLTDYLAARKQVGQRV